LQGRKLGPHSTRSGFTGGFLTGGADTENNYDLFEVAAGDGAGMPPRILGADEAIYVLEGALTVESDGQLIGGGNHPPIRRSSRFPPIEPTPS
jgi:hypothetical protein